MARAVMVLRQVLAWRSYIITCMTPIILSPLFAYDGTEYQKPARCTFVLLNLVVFWTTECMPIAVTAMLPMFLYPLFQIATAKDMAPKYMSEVNMAFIGSYIMVIAFESANLHKRFALRILLTVGPQPRWLLFGTMMSACFLSMFTNNTMSCALHLPIVKGIIDELREAAEKQSKAKKVTPDLSPIPVIAVTECAESAVVDDESVGYSNVAVNERAVDVDADQETETVNAASPESIELHYIGQTKIDILAMKTEVLTVDIPSTLDKDTDQSSPESALSPTTSTLSPRPEDDDTNALSRKTIDGLEKMLLIAAAYSASIGGMCTLIGTPTNLIMKERADIVFESYNCTQQVTVTFTSWLVFGVPVGYCFIFLAWFWLQIFFLGPRYVCGVWIIDPFRCCLGLKPRDESRSKARVAKQNERVTAVIHQLYSNLEPMGFRQYAVVAHCVVLIFLLITRQMSTGGADESYIGWGIIAPKYVKESTATILISASLFIFPSRLPSFHSTSLEPPPTLLKWKQVDKEFPFGVILLLGGGMAAAYGAQESGLPALIAPVFRDIMKDLPMSICVLFTSIMVASMTEFMSNIACVTLIAPIMEKLAKQMDVNPLLFLFPTTLSASFAFMLPVATPPNALVFSTNRLRIIDMVMCGIGMNIIGVIVVFVATNTWGDAYFSLFTPPCSQ